MAMGGYGKKDDQVQLSWYAACVHSAAIIFGYAIMNLDDIIRKQE